MQHDEKWSNEDLLTRATVKMWIIRLLCQREAPIQVPIYALYQGLRTGPFLGIKMVRYAHNDLKENDNEKATGSPGKSKR